MNNDSKYADDYAHHSITGQPNFNGDNTDFAHHAALYGAYLASKENERNKSEKKAEAGTTANGSTSNANTNDGQSGCVLLAIVVIVLVVIISMISMCAKLSL